MDQAIRAIATGALNKMWAGSLTYYESQFTEENHAKHSRFPGKRSSSLTPDCCKAKGKCPPESLWKKEPWASLYFVPVDEATGMRFDYISAGEGDQARFVASVAIDRACTGKPIYLSREGAINENGDVTGTYQPVEGSSPPPLPAPK